MLDNRCSFDPSPMSLLARRAEAHTETRRAWTLRIAVFRYFVPGHGQRQRTIFRQFVAFLHGTPGSVVEEKVPAIVIGIAGQRRFEARAAGKLLVAPNRHRIRPALGICESVADVSTVLGRIWAREMACEWMRVKRAAEHIAAG